jgi:hypothetical protein
VLLLNRLLLLLLLQQVNIEVDVLGKYVERSLASVLDRLDVLEQQKPAAAAAAAAAPLATSSNSGSSSSSGGIDLYQLEDRIGAVEHKVTSRDLIIDSLEERLLKLEKQLEQRTT